MKFDPKVAADSLRAIEEQKRRIIENKKLLDEAVAKVRMDLINGRIKPLPYSSLLSKKKK